MNFLHIEQAMSYGKTHRKLYLINTDIYTRNPLSAVLQSADEIQYLVESLFTGNEPPAPALEILEAAETILACGEHQKKIIDDILNVSKLDAGLLTVDPIPVQPHVVLRRAHKIFIPEFKSKSITSTFKARSSQLPNAKSCCSADYLSIDHASIHRLLRRFLVVIRSSATHTSVCTIFLKSSEYFSARKIGVLILFRSI